MLGAPIFGLAVFMNLAGGGVLQVGEFRSPTNWQASYIREHGWDQPGLATHCSFRGLLRRVASVVLWLIDGCVSLLWQHFAQIRLCSRGYLKFY